jgi:hypothetical protein
MTMKLTITNWHHELAANLEFDDQGQTSTAVIQPGRSFDAYIHTGKTLKISEETKWPPARQPEVKPTVCISCFSKWTARRRIRH